jgi:hypothetical protein
MIRAGIEEMRKRDLPFISTRLHPAIAGLEEHAHEQGMDGHDEEPGTLRESGGIRTTTHSVGD